jgi:uncharacterized membrane protein
MSWRRWQQIRHYYRQSLWIIPVACMAAGLAAAPAIRWIDAQTQWTLLNLGPDGARNILGALAGSLLTFIVFAFSTLTVAVQIASGQLSPRIIARVFEDPFTKTTVGAFVFSWLYTLAALGRIEDHALQLPVAFAIAASLASVLLFLGLVQRISQGLRPVVIMTGIANDTVAVIDEIYPESFSPEHTDHAVPSPEPGQATKTILHEQRSGVVRAIDFTHLATIAEQAGCTIEIVPMVGDFVATADVVFRTYDGTLSAQDEAKLIDCIDLGAERSLAQDPLFGFRIIVDIAAKALSPAINDPTTGVLAIDQLHYLLHKLAHRNLDAAVVRDRSGSARLICPTPDWEDFVAIAVTEIRLYGASSPQVTRRLQAMLQTLLPLVPVERRPALDEQVALLHRTIEHAYADPADRVQANRADTQGFGHPRSEDVVVRG